MVKNIIVLFLFSSLVYAHDEIYEGQFTYGHEVSTFSPCNSGKIYWLEGSGFLASEIKALALKSEKPYTPIYLKIRGHEHFEEVDGFQAEYEHQMHLSEVIDHDVKMPSSCK